jgi:anti-sigma factor RsiW
MKKLSDEDLILHFYGEGEAREADEVRRQLASSPELRARYEALCRTLEAAGSALPVPERTPSYGAEVWARLEPRLSAAAASPDPGREGDRGRILTWPAPLASSGTRRRTWLAAAAVFLLAAGFLAGRFWPRPGGSGKNTVTAESPFPAAARARILARTVATHLEGSERLFTELANARGEGPVDVSAERRWASDLLAANRLYRQSTARGGRPRLTSLLDELEPFLIELSHAPDEMPANDLDEFLRRFEDRALLFKMRVVTTRLTEPQSL